MQRIENLGPDVEKLIMDFKRDIEESEVLAENYWFVMRELNMMIETKQPVLRSLLLPELSVTIEKRMKKGIEHVIHRFTFACDCGCVLFTIEPQIII